MKFYSLPASIILVLCIAPLQAQILSDLGISDTDTVIDVTEEVLPGVTNLRLGLGPVTGTDYEGDDSYDIDPAPMISFHYRDLLQINNNNIRINLFGKDGLFDSTVFRAGPLLKLDTGRDETGSPDLTGLGDVGTSIELGVFASYTYKQTRARFRIQHDVISGHRGLKLVGDIRYVTVSSNDLIITSTASIEWANNDFMHSYFSITPEQSIASGLPEYNAGSGIKNIGLSLGANYTLSRHWAVVANLGYKRLIGDVARSPLVRMRGSVNQFSSGMFAVYVF
jgi:outer membrane protein